MGSRSCPPGEVPAAHGTARALRPESQRPAPPGVEGSKLCSIGDTLFICTRYLARQPMNGLRPTGDVPASRPRVKGRFLVKLDLHSGAQPPLPSSLSPLHFNSSAASAITSTAAPAEEVTEKPPSAAATAAAAAAVGSFPAPAANYPPPQLSPPSPSLSLSLSVSACLCLGPPFSLPRGAIS
ncbi:Protein of unknown function [Gryllus bimaculatus]|nr:Protein of unknown function [Gryllus bimaculatus]